MLLVVMNAMLFLLYGNLAPDNSGVGALCLPADNIAEA
uniref:Uncharacterized protein n=1 Tax=Zea mays TaxID=4577 RepID=B4FVY4_MAIZE|nr:unknown [Zea mays]